MTDAQPRTYPPGVPCWIDTEQPDPEAASRFYAELFGWTFHDAMPPGAPGSYLIAQLDGRDVAAVAPGDGTPGWSTYIAVADADATAAAVIAAGGAVLQSAADAGPGGRMAVCADPQGAVFRLWQARRRLGAQLVNAPGAWNFSDLHTPAVAAARSFYATVFGWHHDDDLGVGAATMVRVPGYGAHLAGTVDPGIYQRQAAAPPGFADAIGSLGPLDPAEPERSAHWQVTFTVRDRDAGAATVERLGGAVLSTSRSPWAKLASVRDPQGAPFVISQFARSA